MVVASKSVLSKEIRDLEARADRRIKHSGMDEGDIIAEMSSGNLVNAELFFITALKANRDTVTKADIEGVTKLMDEMEHYIKKTGSITADANESFRIWEMVQRTKWSHGMWDYIQDNILPGKLLR
jgi:hypothetical protein